MTLRSFMPAARYLGGEDPFVTVQRALQRSLDDVWRGMPAAPLEAAALPVRLDVREDAKAFHVTADLPGLSEKEVDVTFDDGVLTIRGEKKVERDEKKDTWHVVERSSGSFARQLSLATAIDANAIEARFDKGVLSVTLPKLAEEKASARKIEIKAS
ncbi:MAG: Hsp20/alpha crystallin family protein [Alphaproteobacteria bacterium]|nr:Hsp20/alpha crystallin family protein [Alphaproteobacteria bacterium]